MLSLIRLIKETSAMTHPQERKVVMNNVAHLSVLQIITYLLPIIIVPYLFRTLGPEKFGLIAFAQALVQYFAILTDYGFSISATKEISLCRNEHAKVCQVFASVMSVKIILAFLSLLLLSSIVYCVPRFRNDWLVYVLSFGTVTGSALFPIWFFQGMEKMKYIARLNSMGGVMLAFFIFSLVKKPQHYLMVPLLNSSVMLITGLAGQYIAFSRFRVLARFPGYKNIRQQLRAGWNVFISVAAINAYTATRVFILGLFTNNTITGFYSVAEKIANACQTFPLDSFSQALFPRLSKLFQENSVKALTIMRQLQKIATIIATLCLPIIFIFAGFIVTAVCAKAYPEAILSLRLLLIAVFFVIANAFRVQFLLVCGKTRAYSRIHVTMAAIGVPILLFSIYYFSYVGAALATAVIEAGTLFATYRTIKNFSFPENHA
jgi:PST family polysaccharide transporter